MPSTDSTTVFIARVLCAEITPMISHTTTLQKPRTPSPTHTRVDRIVDVCLKDRVAWRNKQGLVRQNAVKYLSDEEIRSERILHVLAETRAMGWTPYKHKGSESWYGFKKGKEHIPIILEDHDRNSKTKHGYLTTAPWKKDMSSMGWREYNSWSKTDLDNYIKNIKSLGWKSFGRSPTRKMIDTNVLSNIEIREILESFDSIRK